VTTWLLFLSGVALGGLVAWFWAQSKSKNDLTAFQIEAEGSIRAGESTVSGLRAQIDELRRELGARGKETSELQERLKTEGELRATAEARREETQVRIEEEKQLLAQAREKLADTFKALSAEALKSNNQAFIALAGSTFETIQAQAKGDLETRQEAIGALVKPLMDTLGRYEKQIFEMEKSRQTVFGTLEEQLRSLAKVNQQLQEETGSLVTALKAPQVRGRWGEMTLRRVAELAGMSEHCDFTEQETLTTEAVRQRPDMVVRLPGDRRIAVDAKVPLQAFIDAASATNEDERRKHYARHAQLVRAHMNQLGARSYWEQLDPAPEMVVLFLPGESFFSAALEQDRTLIEDGMEKRVILATPTTLIALLRAVAYGWRQRRVEENAQAISDLGKQLHDRLKSFVGHFADIGNSLRRAVEAYNKATGSLESRVLVSTRKFKELGAATGDEILEVEPLDETPRALEAAEGSEMK